MLAPGTRGDVAAPGLGARLRETGHDVTIVADAPCAQLAANTGCAFRPVAADLRQLVVVPPARAARPPSAGACPALTHGLRPLAPCNRSFVVVVVTAAGCSGVGGGGDCGLGGRVDRGADRRLRGGADGRVMAALVAASAAAGYRPRHCPRRVSLRPWRAAPLAACRSRLRPRRAAPGRGRPRGPRRSPRPVQRGLVRVDGAIARRDRLQPGARPCRPGGVDDQPSGHRDEAEPLTALRADDSRGLRAGLVPLDESVPVARDPGLGSRPAPTARHARQGLVEQRVAGRRGIEDRDPAPGDIDAAGGGEPHDSGTGQPEPELRGSGLASRQGARQAARRDHSQAPSMPLTITRAL